MGGVWRYEENRRSPRAAGAIDSVVVESRRYVLEGTLTRDIDDALDDT